MEAAESIKVYATSQAKVLQTYVAPGEYVEKGTLLFELDTENLQTMAETARLQYEAALSGADTTIIQSKNAYDSAGSMYSTLKDNRDAIEDAWDSAREGWAAVKKLLEAAGIAEDADLEALLVDAKADGNEELVQLLTNAIQVRNGYTQAQNAYIQNYDKLD